MGKYHTVLDGQNLSTIARSHGCRSWQQIYEAPQNLRFRRERPDPNLIYPGDVVYIPDEREFALGAETRRQNTFRVGSPSPLPRGIEFRFVSAEEPTFALSGLRVELIVRSSGDSPLVRVTDSLGIIRLEDDVLDGVLDTDTVRVNRIRYPPLGSEGEWDEHGGDFTEGQSHEIALPRTVVRWQGLQPLARSARRPGLDEQGNPADDMKSGDYTEADIDRIGGRFAFDPMTAGSSRFHFDALRNMASGLFATGELDDNIHRMIDNFEADTGAEYSDPALTRAVDRHPSTARFRQNIREEFRRLVAEHEGRADLIPVDEMQLRGRPRYNEDDDLFGGLTIAINDTHAYDVDLIRYRRLLDRYQAAIRLTIYDHFGLDRPDVTKKYGYLQGFRSWFILQHLDRLAYKPFVTRIELEFDVNGRLRGPDG